jgi:uncharacterized membrane protein
MSPELNEWLQLFFRWIHIFAAIMWVGTTYYFTWLDRQFSQLEKAASGGEKLDERNVWMVHSGGFYVVEKQKIPQLMPQTLHWFKWEAAITWLSGFFLFGLVYYHGGMMVEAEDWPIKKGVAIGLSFGFLILGWVAYDLLLTKLFKNEIVGMIISFLLITGLAYIFTRGIKALNLPPLFPARAAYMQLGSMLGTIMTANVWMRILPPQRRMVAALKAGQQPDLSEGARAKMRSKHNTFIVVPVVFLMISNHYPSTFGSPHNWLILSGMVLLGWIAAAILRRA